MFLMIYVGQITHSLIYFNFGIFVLLLVHCSCDLIPLYAHRFKGISHYEGSEGQNRTALPCPGELLVEEHHSNYGEPWAGGRDVFEFLAQFSHITPDAHVLEIGCGTLRVGLHFIRFLKRGHYHCLERDELSMMAAFRYELPSQGLLSKRPLIVKGGHELQ